MKINQIKATVAALLVATGGLTSTFAVPTVLVSIDNGANWTTMAGSNLRLGSWRINATAFSTAGVSGQAPELGFSSFDATSRLPGNLLVRLFDTGFSWNELNGYFLSEIAGTVTGGSRLSVTTWLDPSNGTFAGSSSTDLLTSQPGIRAGNFTSLVENYDHGIPTGLFSMMFQASISQRVGGGIVSFSSSLVDPRVPDGGSTLLLIGFGLTALAFFKGSRGGR